MSIQSAKAFLEKMKTDQAFSKKVAESKNEEDRMKFVKEAGFDFTSAEINSLRGELSEDDLKAVAGGGDIVCDILWKKLG